MSERFETMRSINTFENTFPFLLVIIELFSLDRNRRLLKGWVTACSSNGR